MGEQHPYRLPEPLPKTVEPAVKPGWRDPECPKCGIVLGNKMMYCCPHAHCPVGLN
jgi:hypothetical protein